MVILHCLGSYACVYLSRPNCFTFGFSAGCTYICMYIQSLYCKRNLLIIIWLWMLWTHGLENFCNILSIWQKFRKFPHLTFTNIVDISGRKFWNMWLRVWVYQLPLNTISLKLPAICIFDTCYYNLVKCKIKSAVNLCTAWIILSMINGKSQLPGQALVTIKKRHQYRANWMSITFLVHSFFHLSVSGLN